MRSRIAIATLALAIVAVAVAGYLRVWPNWEPGQRFASASQVDRGFESISRYIRGNIAPNERFDIAASITQVGHWQLANPAGEPFTASGPQELARALETLATDARHAKRPLRILIDDATLFDHANALAELPANSRLSVMIDGRDFALSPPDDSTSRRRIEIRPGLLADASNLATLLEVLHQLERPLRRPKVRMLALEPGGSIALSRVPVVDPGARHARPDVVDPSHLAEALPALAGQLLLVSGRLEKNTLIYKPGSGRGGAVSLDMLKSTVRTNDISLLLLDASSARQPGTRNWLWQRIALSSMEKAMGGATFGEFLRALAGEPDTLIVTARAPARDRIDLLIEPSVKRQVAPVAQLTQVVSGTWSNIVSETAGAISVRSLKASMLTVNRQQELERRILPGVPYVAQVGYLVLMSLGFLAFPVASAWWQRIWPHETATDYEGHAGLVLAHAVRGAALVLAFLPLVALPALCVRLIKAPSARTA